jgi:alpha-1,2-mannosyltransferase
MHLPLPDKLNTLIRALAALVTLGLCWWVARSRDSVRSAFTILLLAVVYLMLFNPRTETNSYVMLGAFAALWAAYEITVGRRRDIAAWLVALVVILGSECYGWPIFPYTDHWAKAAATIGLGLWLATTICRAPKGESILMPSSETNPART